MKEITLRVTDEMAVIIEQLVEHMVDVEVMDTDECPDDDTRDQWFKQAIMELKDDKVIRRPRDYAWIMAAIDQDVMADYESFISPQAFIEYMVTTGLTMLPDRTTLFRAYNLIDGEYPNWTFDDDPDDLEARRRMNVVVRFKSAYYRAKRAKCNS